MKCITFIVIATAAFAIGCQAPKENLSSSSSKTYAKDQTTVTPLNTGAALATCGSSVGSNPKVKECVAKGMFYDRQFADPASGLPVGQCTTKPLAAIPCTVDGAKAVMSATDADVFGKYYTEGAAPLKGFEIDQIMDCSSPASAGDAGCSAKTDYPGTKKVQIFFVMADGVGKIQMKNLVVYIPVK